MGADEHRLSVVSARIRNVKKLNFAYLLPIFLCIYSIVKEIKVGEPFMYKYQTEYLNLTASQLTSEIYPFYPYAYMLILIPIFLFTDLFLYKPTMLLEVLGQIGFRSSLVFTYDVFSQQLGQIAYGIASASEVAFFSYIYAKLEKDQYRKLTSWTRAGTMGGRTCGYLLSQLIILGGLGTYRTLNEIAFVIPCIVLVACIFLPRVQWKAMIARMSEGQKRIGSKQQQSSKKARALPTTYTEYILYRTRKLKSDFIKIYSIGFIRKWSFWWAMTTCMSLQVAQYAQALWGEVQVDKHSPLNGFAEAGYTFTATFAILALNAIPIDWDKYGEVALVLISSIDAGVLLLYSQTGNIYVMYGCYIAYRSLYQVMITIAQWNIAKKMVCESYGLVFGANSFIALIMQSIIMFIVADKRGLSMPVRQQYVVYAGLHFLIAVIFAISVAYTVFTYFCQKTTKIIDQTSSTTKSTMNETESDAAGIIERRASRKSSTNRKISILAEPLELQVKNIEQDVENRRSAEFSDAEIDSESDDDILVSDDEQPTFSSSIAGTMAASFSASMSKV
uniref:Reduced folate carrier n=1 Tax=Panagrolaimus sp. PS1159 TaxID=55785 RepID=A0AC35GY51_9BILA